MHLDRSICNDYGVASAREWLVTNGIGGYASGTVAGAHTRRYHGLLVAALEPPVRRTVTLSKLEETVDYGGRHYALSSNRWSDGSISPTGYVLLDGFSLDGTTPVWRFRLADALLEKRIWMEPGSNATYIRYRVLDASDTVSVRLTALVTYRDHHATTKGGQWQMVIESNGPRLRILAFEGASPVHIATSAGDWNVQHVWYRGMRLARESDRGLDDVEDVLAVGCSEARLNSGDSVAVSASVGDPLDPSRINAAWRRRVGYERELVRAAGSPRAIRRKRLVLAADQFLVKRLVESESDGASVIAGYPWFTDWGRDTMIALPGLTLYTGRASLCAQILRTYARFVDQGMLPNRFPDAGEPPEYNTVDATLWFFDALRQYLEITQDTELLKELEPVLEDIIEWHVRGTRFGIRMDEADHLLTGGEVDVQLTWMDAKVGDWVVTPRIGKPIEINALWLNALAFMGRYGSRGERFRALADGVRAGMQRYWNGGSCFDVLDGPNGNDTTLRPNQLLAVSLPECPFDDGQRREIVSLCTRELFTPHGVRTRGPREPEYEGRYTGGPRSRDGAYHQGTAWAWLIGAFVRAHLRVGTKPYWLREAIRSLSESLDSHGLGSVSEVFDGDPPHAPGGCIAQAWSVAELLVADVLIENAVHKAE